MKVSKAKQNKQLRAATSPRAQANTDVAQKPERTKRAKIPRIDKASVICRREYARVYKQMRRKEIGLNEAKVTLQALKWMEDSLQKLESAAKLESIWQQYNQLQRENGLVATPMPPDWVDASKATKQ